MERPVRDDYGPMSGMISQREVVPLQRFGCVLGMLSSLEVKVLCPT